ncbi:MAG TPA: hypothetical protein PKD15_02685 [Candidatus Saccharibacteria bacterium]|jgi:hypothetical protein|nr:hypothetical protein [Candidatus Saccharibacteria bacterium]
MIKQKFATKPQLYIKALMKKRFVISLAVIIALVLVTVIVYWPIISGTRTVYSGLDNVDQFYPWYQKMSSSFHTGDYALWDANVLGGKSFIGETQPGVLYPLNILWIWSFGSSSGITRHALELLVVVHGFIAIAGMYWLVRRFHLRRSYALIAGITYAAFGPVVARTPAQICIYYGLTWIPFVIGAFIRAVLDKQTILYGAISGIASGLIILSGHLQPFIHTMIIVGGISAWLLIKSSVPRKKITTAISTTIIALILIGGAQVYSSYKWLGDAYRLYGDGYHVRDEKPSLKSFVKDFIVEPSDLGNFLEPGFLPENNSFYIGLLPLMSLIILGVLYVLKRQEDIRILGPLNTSEKKVFCAIGIIGLFGLIVSFGYRTFVASLLYFVPMLGNTVRQMSRYTILFHFSLVLIYVFILNTILQKKISWSGPKRTMINGALVLVTLLQAVYFFLIPSTSINRFYKFQVVATFLCIAVVMILSRWKKSYARYAPVFVMIATVLTAHLNIYIYSMRPKQSALPERVYARTPIVDYLESKSKEGYRTFIMDGALPQNIGDVYDIQTVTGYGATIYKPYLDFIEHNKRDVGVSFDPVDSKYADAMSVRYVVSKQKLNLPLLMTDGKVKLYERRTYYHKVMSVDSVGILNQIPYEIIQIGNNTSTIRIGVSNDTRIVLSEFAAPGRTLKVDGVKAKLETYDPIRKNSFGPFISTMLSPGNHVIELNFKPL